MNKEIWTIGRILQWTEQYFRNKEMDTPRLDGEVLLSHILGKDRIYLYTHYDQPLTKEELDAFRPLVIERAKGYSVATLVGYKEFMGLTFMVNDQVLIPRPDTETLIEYVLDQVPRYGALKILDVCHGPGTILFSLLHYLPNANGLGLEISDQAIEIAMKNREQLGLSDRSRVVKSDMFQYVRDNLDTYKNSFDIIVSNPPYIKTGDMKLLAPEVLHEPHMALDGGGDGLDFYRIICNEAGQYLKSGGLLAMEIGVDQENDVSSLAKKTGIFTDAEYIRDLGNHIRVVAMKKL